MAGIVSIAQALNISPSTVSRALSRPDMVSAQTRELILREAQKQGYLHKVMTNPVRQIVPPSIGILVADLNNSFSSLILNAALDVFTGSEYYPVVNSSCEDPQREARILKQWERLHLAGVIVMPTSGFYKSYTANLAEVPVVLVDRDVPEINCSKVLVDNDAGAKLCVEHLLQQGHSKILFVSGSHNVYTFKKRSEAAQRAYAQVEIAELKAVSYEELYMGAFELMNMILLRPKDKRPTAIVASNNALAAGILYAVNLKQLQMPDDIALISFGDCEWTRFYPTSISALRMPADDLGRMAAEIMLQQLQSSRMEDSSGQPHKPVQNDCHLLSPMLMPRASTIRR